MKWVGTLEPWVKHQYFGSGIKDDWNNIMYKNNQDMNCIKICLFETNVARHLNR